MGFFDRVLGADLGKLMAMASEGLPLLQQANDLAGQVAQEATDPELKAKAEQLRDLLSRLSGMAVSVMGQLG